MLFKVWKGLLIEPKEIMSIQLERDTHIFVILKNGTVFSREMPYENSAYEFLDDILERLQYT